MNKLKYSWLYWLLALTISGLVLIWWRYKRSNLKRHLAVCTHSTEHAIVDPSQNSTLTLRSIHQVKLEAKQKMEQLQPAAMLMSQERKDNPSQFEDPEVSERWD